MNRDLPTPSLPLALAEQVDQVCNRFEAEWQAGRRPRIEDYLDDATEPGRSALLRELLASEREWRGRRGERPTMSEYRVRFPGDDELIAAVFAKETPPGARPWPPAGRAGTDDNQLFGTQDDGSRHPEAPTLADEAAPATAQPAAPAIPGYLIEGILGRGAMGVVYLARQIRLNRLCALKMILAGAHADVIASSRFLAEAEAEARLRHPNIIQIHHIGEAGGLPFFELEYLEGGSLDRRLDGTPWPARQAAALIEPVARGIAEAHRLGLIHRDLKPGNILLADDGTPKITDFGLVKSLESGSGLTASESVMGTPSYMAPEQAEGKAKHVGPAADVYALGAILYELLTGRPPFRGATMLDTLEQVKTAEPVSPSRLVPSLSRDIETIALKCLHKDPAKRYGSAAVLAEDLRRLLGGEPIRARRTGPIDRAWRWCRRNPWLAGANITAALLTAILAVVSTVAAWTFHNQRNRLASSNRSLERAHAAEQAASQAERQHRTRAEQSFGLAMEAVKTYYMGITEEVLLRRPDLKDLRKRLLQSPLEFYAKLKANLEDRRSDDPETRARLAEACFNLGTINAQVGSIGDARTAYQQARDLREALARQHPADDGYRRELAGTYRRMSLIDRDAGLYENAERASRQALVLCETLLRDHPESDRDRDELAGLQVDLGTIYLQIGRHDRAEAAFRAALKIRETLDREHPGDDEYRKGLAHVQHNLGLLYMNTGRSDRAEASYRAALAVREALAREHSEVDRYRNDLANAHNNLGIFYQNLNRYGEAETAHRAALAILLALHREKPAYTKYRYDLSNTHNNLGTLHQLRGRYDEAEAAYRAALEIQRELAREFPDVLDHVLDLGMLYLNLGLNENDRGRPGAAPDWFAKAIPPLEDALRREPRHALARDLLHRVYGGRAQASRRMSRHGEALADWDRAIGFTDDPKRDQFRVYRAEAVVNLGRHDAAIAEVDALGEAPPEPVGESWYRLGLICALSSSAARTDAARPAAEQEGRSEALAARAVGFLARAGGAGAFDDAGFRRALNNAPAFDALRLRPDFRVRLRDWAFPADPFAP